MDIEETHGAEAMQNNEISDEDLGDVAGGNILKKTGKFFKKRGNNLEKNWKSAGNEVAKPFK